MLEEVVSVGMPVNERIVIRKMRHTPGMVSRDMRRVSIVTGIHGDELDGQYICYEINRIINENPELLSGIVDVYPAVNPLGLESCTRGMPMFDLDMNRVFPGFENGATAEYLAFHIVNDIIGSDMCVDLHSSNIFIKEVPQVRVFDQFKDKLMPYAMMMNADFIWEYKISTVQEATLANSLNNMNVPTLILEMGSGYHIEKDFCNQVVKGVFNLLTELGIWKGEKTPVKKPYISSDGEVCVIHAGATGLFVAEDGIGTQSCVKKGDHLGDIVDPKTGTHLKSIDCEKDGFVMTFRADPIVYEGAILCRIFGGGLDA